MVGTMKGSAQAIAAQTAIIEQERTKRDSAGPAGGLLIAVGTSLLLWAAIAQAVKLASSFLF